MNFRLETKKGGEDFMEHSLEGFLRGFTIQWDQKRVWSDGFDHFLNIFCLIHLS